MWCGGCLEAAPQQTSVSQTIDICGERAGGPAPPELVHVPEQGRVRPERRQLLEQQRSLTVVPQHLRGEVLDAAVLVEEASRRDRSDPRNAGIAVRRVADERQEIGDEHGLDAELLAHPGRVTDLLSFTVDLH